MYVPNNDPAVSGESSGIYQIQNDSGSGDDWSMEKVLELPGDYPVNRPCLAIWEDHLYLLQRGSTSSDSVIRKIDLDTGDIETVVSDEMILQMQIRAGELYYLSGYIGEKFTESPAVYLIRCDLDGNNSEELMEKTVLGAGGDFFFYEDPEEDSKDAVIYIAPRNFYTSDNDIIVTNLETGDSGQITPDSFRKKVTEYSLIQAIWPEDDFVCFSAAHTRSMDESPTDSGVYRLSETNQTIENIESKGGASLCLQENELYTLQYKTSDGTLMPTITRTNLETMEAVTYPTTVYADDFQKLVSATEGYQYGLQVTSKGVFLVTSYTERLTGLSSLQSQSIRFGPHRGFRITRYQHAVPVFPQARPFTAFSVQFRNRNIPIAPDEVLQARRCVRHRSTPCRFSSCSRCCDRAHRPGAPDPRSLRRKTGRRGV